MSVTAIRFAGSRAVLVELSNLATVMALAAHLKGSPLPGQLDVLGAASTVLVTFESRNAARSAANIIAGMYLEPAPKDAGKLLEIYVHYNGDDLATVARLANLSTEAVIAAHTGQIWQAAFGGFAPGFAYLLGENQALHVPRRDTPRTNVPEGAVALAGDYSAIYPRQSPGGWQLIGNTEAVLWSLGRENPALIMPQDRVRFIPTRARLKVNDMKSSNVDTPPIATRQSIGLPTPPLEGLVVLSSGPQSLIQDLGRPGLGDLGVSTSGAVDSASARQANRLVGNQPTDAVIESLMGSLTLQAQTDQILAVTGARSKLVISPSDTDPSTPRDPVQDAAFALLAGETLTLSPVTAGLRCYIGVRGGIDVVPVMGSRSTDVMSGIGPAPLRKGSHLRVGPISGSHVVGFPEPDTLRQPTADGVVELRIIAGPREDWFGPQGLLTLTGQNWLVSDASNRIGVRLLPETGGTRVSRTRDGELASEGVVWGAVQIPPSGFPVLFLADHPVTGGYPVIGSVITEDLPAASQLPPGAKIRFILLDPDSLELIHPVRSRNDRLDPCQ